jgi:hypothetical protein
VCGCLPEGARTKKPSSRDSPRPEGSKKNQKGLGLELQLYVTFKLDLVAYQQIAGLVEHVKC